MTITIGSVTLDDPVILAPMSGVTDLPFRRLVKRCVAGLVVSEMIASQAMVRETRRTMTMASSCVEEQPMAVQLAGCEPAVMAEAAKLNQDRGAAIIDINFGCPAKKVCRKAAGSALLKDSDLVDEIVRATVRAVPVPVTVKMRTGWSPQMKNAVEIALRMEAAGVAAIAVHGRTRACRFLGSAEHDTVAEIKSRLSIPVFANGDIDSAASARNVLRQTGVDGIMIGRAALGRPWLLGDIARGRTAARSLDEILAVMSQHVKELHDFYGEPGIRIARKHVQWYFQQLTESGVGKPHSVIGKAFNQICDADAQLEFLNRIPALMEERLAA